MPSEPGWYPDPLGGQGARYWDGSQWDGAIQPGPPTGPQALPEPPQGAENPQRLWPVWAGLGVTVAIAVGSAVFVLTRPTVLAPKAAPAAPPTAVTVASTTTSSSTAPPASDVARQVKTLMQDKFDTDAKFRTLGLEVADVSLVHKVGNEYRGTATINGPGGTLQTAVDVTADGSNILWQIDSDTLSFTPTKTSVPPANAVPGADQFGFFDGPRCSRFDAAAMVMRTAQSEIAICQGDGPDVYRYNGKRLSDGDYIELRATPTEADGFIAVNPADGTQYVVTRQGLQIITPSGETFTEPATAVGP